MQKGTAQLLIYLLSALALFASNWGTCVEEISQEPFSCLFTLPRLLLIHGGEKSVLSDQPEEVWYMLMYRIPPAIAQLYHRPLKWSHIYFRCCKSFNVLLTWRLWDYETCEVRVNSVVLYLAKGIVINLEVLYFIYVGGVLLSYLN